MTASGHFPVSPIWFWTPPNPELELVVLVSKVLQEPPLDIHPLAAIIYLKLL